MKIAKLLAIAGITTLTILACSKNDNPSNNTAIQHKWIFDSIVVYSNSQLTGPSYHGMTGNNIDFYNFSSNGKVYTFMQGSYDSGTYHTSGNQLYTRAYVSGVLSPKTDTATIKVVTDKSLIIVSRNGAGDYGKFCFKK